MVFLKEQQHLPGGSDANHLETQPGQLASGLRTESRVSWIQNKW